MKHPITLETRDSKLANIDAATVTAIEERGSGCVVFVPGGSIAIKANRADVFAAIRRATGTPPAEAPPVGSTVQGGDGYPEAHPAAPAA